MMVMQFILNVMTIVLAIWLAIVVAKTARLEWMKYQVEFRGAEIICCWWVNWDVVEDLLKMFREQLEGVEHIEIYKKWPWSRRAVYWFEDGTRVTLWLPHAGMGQWYFYCSRAIIEGVRSQRFIERIAAWCCDGDVMEKNTSDDEE